EPLYESMREFFEKKYKIPIIIDTTASGYHLSTNIESDSKPFNELAALGKGHLHQELLDKYSTNDPSDCKRYKATPEKFAYAYYGLGKIMQYAALELIKNFKGNLPVTIGDVAIGSEKYPKHGISIDLSQYCDPYYIRVIRLPASTHQKHIIKNFADKQPAIDIIRQRGMSYKETLELMWDQDKAIKYYTTVSGKVPVSGKGWLDLIKNYKKSEVYKLHLQFEKNEESVDLDKLALELPPCLSQIFHHPFPNVLKPTNLKSLSQILLKKGMTVNQIKYIVNELYEKIDFEWEPTHKYDRRQKANFWMSYYTTETLLGLNNEETSCKVHKRKGYGICPKSLDDFCDVDLADFSKEMM
ncbi:MAG: hypothetical protein KAS39_08610, partial [Actinomycetia bacterium]|nr:hypothetical protein [Actinomycetes bacterium]